MRQIIMTSICLKTLESTAVARSWTMNPQHHHAWFDGSDTESDTFKHIYPSFSSHLTTTFNSVSHVFAYEKFQEINKTFSNWILRPYSRLCIVAAFHFNIWCVSVFTRAATCTQEVALQGRVTSLDLCPDHRQLLSCSRDNSLQLLDLRNSNDRVLFR